nr:PH domain-containing protein [Nakamurella flavida]
MTVGTHGLEIRGVGGGRTVRWAEIVRVSAPSRRRMGIASTTLELELVDDELLLFGRLDLGTDPERVAAAIAARRPR